LWSTGISEHYSKNPRANPRSEMNPLLATSRNQTHRFFLAGRQIFHNCVRPYMALDNKTPADLAGIKVQGTDKWLTIIQNAVKAKDNIRYAKG
jgi:hypothetical protein